MVTDIVCPLYKAEKIVNNIIDSLEKQKDIRIGRLDFPVTRTPDCEKTVKVIEERGYSYFLVDKQDFSHSLTRERAIKDYCENEVVVMMSQDIRFLSEYSVSKLCESVKGQVVYAYGRQTAKKSTVEYYIREANYGGTSRKVSEADIESLQLKAFFSSDAFSAYNRAVFLALNGYDGKNMMMNEDMYYSRKVLLSGYEKAYVADAVVEHYHNYTLKTLYNRYYETGKWFHDFPEFKNYKAMATGGKLAKSVFKAALKDFNLPVLFKFLPNMAARYLGMKKGEKYDGRR